MLTLSFILLVALILSPPSRGGSVRPKAPPSPANGGPRMDRLVRPNR